MSLSNEAKSDPSLVSPGSRAGLGEPIEGSWRSHTRTWHYRDLFDCNTYAPHWHEDSKILWVSWWVMLKPSPTAARGALPWGTTQPVTISSEATDEIEMVSTRVDYTPEDIASATATARFLAGLSSPRDEPRPAVTQLMRDYWGIRHSGKVTHHEAIGLLRVLRDSR